MNTDTILRLLQNSGFHGLRADAEFVYAEDPSCILRSFETFIEYAWVIIAVLTGVMLFGWAVSLLRGAKNDYFSNLKNLVLIFGILTISGPILNLVYGGNLFAIGCKTIKVSIADIQEILDKRGIEFINENAELYENIDIYDSGIVTKTPPTNTTPSEQPRQTTNTTPPEQPRQTDTMTPEQTKHDTRTPTQTNASSIPVSAQESGKDVIYTLKNGTKIKKTGGYRSWRNNNPGNIRYSEFTRRVGAIGQAGGFAVFPSEEIGMYAIEALLRSDSYNKLTVAGAISRYAPPSENNTSEYHRKIEKLTGLSINKRMAELTPDELTRVAHAIKKIEGWKVGTIERM
ncbi:MAG: hypothetical protein E7011_04235 [Alphaproteobacteria bacterium]|nr:hypothetical protein [Alphaproteobacteria bacterium]